MTRRDPAAAFDRARETLANNDAAEAERLRSRDEREAEAERLRAQYLQPLLDAQKKFLDACETLAENEAYSRAMWSYLRLSKELAMRYCASQLHQAGKAIADRAEADIEFQERLRDRFRE